MRLTGGLWELRKHVYLSTFQGLRARARACVCVFVYVFGNAVFYPLCQICLGQ